MNELDEVRAAFELARKLEQERENRAFRRYAMLAVAIAVAIMWVLELSN